MAGAIGSGQVRMVWALAVAVSTLASVSVQAADPCAGSAWNLSHERAVFATPAVTISAATAAGPSPILAVDKLYDIALTPQDQVRFVLAPEKKVLADGAYAGMVTLHVPSTGRYRVSMSQGIWIDVIADGKFVPTDDFTGMHGCGAPRKIVQFVLPAGEMTLQFSNTNSPSVQVTVTAAPR